VCGITSKILLIKLKYLPFNKVVLLLYILWQLIKMNFQLNVYTLKYRKMIYANCVEFLQFL
jgi:hypothetical protein